MAGAGFQFLVELTSASPSFSQNLTRESYFLPQRGHTLAGTNPSVFTLAGASRSVPSLGQNLQVLSQPVPHFGHTFTRWQPPPRARAWRLARRARS